MNNSGKITYFAETDFRNARRRFGIKENDRMRHMYVIGKKGMGKSTLLEQMAIQDMENGNGFIFFNWSAAASNLLDRVPKKRLKDVIVISLDDQEFRTEFTVFESADHGKRRAIVSQLMDACERLFAEEWDERVSYILEHVFFALSEYPGAALADVNRMLVDETFCREVIRTVIDAQTKSFWAVEFPRHTDPETREAVRTIERVMGQFASDTPSVRAIDGAYKSAFDIRRIMDERKILIVDLSRERLGDKKSAFLGASLIIKLDAAISSRRNISSALLAAMPQFFVYMDDFPFYTSRSFAHTIADARKAKTGLILAHQYREEIPEDVRQAIFGNVGTMIVFQIGSFDAEIFEKEFAPHCTAEDMSGLEKGEMYVRLMIDGVASPVFWATRLTSLPEGEYATRDEVVALSRATHGVTRKEAEGRIRPPSVKDERVAIQSKPIFGTREEKTMARPHKESFIPARHGETAKTDERSRQGERQQARPQSPPMQSKGKEHGFFSQPLVPPPDAIEEKTDEDESYMPLSDLLKKTKEKHSGDAPPASSATISSPPTSPKTIPDAKPAEIPEHTLKSILE